MKALLLKSYSGSAGIELVEIKVSEPGKGEVLVKMAAAPINPSDLIFLQGRNPSSKALPSIPGFEGAGTVIAAGPGAAAKQLLGKRVACRASPKHGGSWAEFMITDAERCVPLLPKVSLPEGAMLLVNPLTAWGFIDIAKSEGHKCAIQTAAASSVGKMMVRWAHKKKFKLINIVRREEQVETLRDMGAPYVLSSDDSHFEKELENLAHKLGAKVAFDTVGGSFANTILKAMPQGSELWSYGGLSGDPVSVQPMILIYQQKNVRGMWLPPLMIARGPKKFSVIMNEIQKNMQSAFKSEVRATYPLHDFRKALADYESGMSAGKSLFTPSPQREG